MLRWPVAAITLIRHCWLADWCHAFIVYWYIDIAILMPYSWYASIHSHCWLGHNILPYFAITLHYCHWYTHITYYWYITLCFLLYYAITIHAFHYYMPLLITFIDITHYMPLFFIITRWLFRHCHYWLLILWLMIIIIYSYFLLTHACHFRRQLIRYLLLLAIIIDDAIDIATCFSPRWLRAMLLSHYFSLRRLAFIRLLPLRH